jgi:hypothetical protein
LAAGRYVYQKLLVVSELVRQQNILDQSDNRSIPDRIVSLSHAHIRPIVRGQARCNVEFGAKISISVTGKGFMFLDRLSFDPYNEGEDQKAQARAYRLRHSSTNGKRPDYPLALTRTGPAKGVTSALQRRPTRITGDRRLYSSITFHNFSRRPSALASNWKSIAQTWWGCSAWRRRIAPSAGRACFCLRGVGRLSRVSQGAGPGSASSARSDPDIQCGSSFRHAYAAPLLSVGTSDFHVFALCLRYHAVHK